MGAPTLFEVPATGEMFDRRPFETEVSPPAVPKVAPTVHACRACGRDVRSPGVCARCESMGHEAPSMEDER